MLRQVLDAQGLDWSEALIKDVAKSLTNTGWVDAPDGDWMGAHHHERLHWSWTSFANAVKHHSRFHFQFNRRLHRYGDDLIGVHEMLPFLGRLIRRHRMVRPLPAKIPLFRVRPGTHPHTVEDLGAPPKEQASAGRMNPAGVPYLYLAFDEKTALAETRASQGQKVTVSQWSPNRDLHVIDLSHGPNIPSIFSEKRQEHEVAQFLYAFRDEISKPVAHDGSEHIEYVPTQAVSEYFSQVFKHGSGKHVDGLIYPSAVASEGKNLVVFPTYKTDVPQGGKQPFPMMHFETARTGRVFFNDHSVI